MKEVMYISGADIGVLVLYFLVILAAGIYAMFKSNRNSVKGYFLAGRFMTFIPVGASLFASNIGSEHFIGLAGSGAAKGIAVGAFEFNAAILLQLLGWVFLPVYISSGVYTLPEYMKKRFGGSRIQLYLTILSLILYIFTKISVNLYSGSLFVNEALGWNLWFAILFILMMTALITLTGGLTAVLYTDLVQTLVMLVGAVLLTGIGFHKIGGFVGLLNCYGSAIEPINLNTSTGQAILMNMSAVAAMQSAAGIAPGVETLAASPNVTPNFKCALPSKNAFEMLRGVSDPEMPWLGFLLGQTPASIWYWCADQMMVQRVLAAKSLSHAQGATLMAGFIKLIPLFIMVIPGMISRILYPETIGCGTAEECFAICGNKYGCSDWAYPKLVMGIMPNGLRGLMLAVMLAALMSDLTSIFNSSSTLFTVDIYTRIRRKASNRELMIVGRLFVLVMVGVSILWVPVIQSMQGGQLYIYIQSVSGYLSPPIAAVYLLALLWKRNNELGAFTGLCYGFIIGIVRMILSFVYTDPLCGEVDTRPWIVAGVHYMYFAMFSFFTTGFIMCFVSLCSKPPTEEQIRGLTFWTRKQEVAPSDGSIYSAPVETEMSPHPHGDENEIEIAVDFAGSTHGEVLVAGGDSSAKLGEMECDFDNGDNDISTSKCTANAQPKGKKALHIAGHVCQWIWGFTERPCPDDVDCCCGLYRARGGDESSFKQDGQVNDSPSEPKRIGLEQSTTAKIGLMIGLIVIVIVTVFLYCFFSLYFGEIVRGPLTVVGTSTSVAIDNALSTLLQHGIVKTWRPKATVTST